MFRPWATVYWWNLRCFAAAKWPEFFAARKLSFLRPVHVQSDMYWVPVSNVCSRPTYFKAPVYKGLPAPILSFSYPVVGGRDLQRNLYQSTLQPAKTSHQQTCPLPSNSDRNSQPLKANNPWIVNRGLGLKWSLWEVPISSSYPAVLRFCGKTSSSYCRVGLNTSLHCPSFRAVLRSGGKTSCRGGG